MGKIPSEINQQKAFHDKMGKLSKARLPALIKKSGRVGDGDGLYFRTLGDGKAYWLYRYRINGRERETSIGPYPEIGLDEARVRHAALRKQVVADKVDPVAEKERVKANEPAQGAVPTFGTVADAYIAAHEKTWRNPKHRWQWGATLTKHCSAIRSIPIDRLDAKAVLSVLTPIWSETPETASRLRGRIERVWASAQVAGHIDPDKPNPARWKGWLDHMLPNPKKIGERDNHAAMHWRDVPAFSAKLRAIDSPAARALEFLILTASRTGEVIDMPWDEVDLDAGTWTVPAARMKMKRDHLVPLSPRAVLILRGQLASRPQSSFGGPHPYVFPGQRPRRGLSNMSFLMLLRRLKIDVTAHGFRSSFRSWCADTGAPFEVAEACLAHSSSSIVAAYQRSAMLERRRPVMEAWALHVGGETPANVVPFRAAG